jgi:5-methylcytosine-specific restriction endonuclease McrA
MNKNVRVELGPERNVIRIFRNKSWRELPVESVQLMDRAAAVKQIRIQVYDRAYNDSRGTVECENCGRGIEWTTMEMNEKVPKGSGGEVSLSNCEALCHRCHQGNPDSAHGNRRWQTAKLSPKD